MPTPTAAEGHYDQMLTDFSIGYIEQNAQNYVAGQVFPVVNVDFKSDNYTVFPRGYFLQDQVAPRPIGGVPREVHYRTRKGTYICEEEGLRARLDRQETANYNGPKDPRQNKINLITQQHLIHRDRKWVREFMRTGVWGTDLAGTPTGSQAGEFPQFDGDDVDLVDFFAEAADTMGQRTGMRPNVMVIGRKVLRAFRRDPMIRDSIKYTQAGAVVTQQLLANLFDIDRVLSPLSVYNAAGGEILDPVSGLPIVREDYRYMVGERDVLLTYAAPSAGLDTVSGGVQFAWTGLLGNGAFNTVINRGTWDYGEWFDCLQAVTPKLVSPDLGVYYSGAVEA